MTNKKVKQTQQIEMHLQLVSDPTADEIAAMLTRLTGEMQTLKKYWKLYQQLPATVSQSVSDILGTREHLQLELLAMAIHLQNTSDQLKTLIYTWRDLPSTIETVVAPPSIEQLQMHLDID